MAQITVTSPNGSYGGKIAGVQFVNGSATVDDTTAAGKALIAFAKRQGWAHTGTAAKSETPIQGKPVSKWTTAECKAYLDGWHVQYPSGASLADLRLAVLAAFEVKAQGGAASPEGAAGHTSGTIPPEGAPPVPNPDKPDNAEKAEQWVTPRTGNVDDDVAPTISDQPDNATVTAGATASVTVAATGDPAPSIQWQRQAKGAGAFVDVPGATSATYVTPALTVADNNGDKLRAVVSNSDGTVTSDAATITVNA